MYIYISLFLLLIHPLNSRPCNTYIDIYITWWGGSGSLVIVVVPIWSHSIFWAALFHSGEQDMVRLVRFQSHDQRRRPEAQQIDVVPACYVVDEVDGVYLEKLCVGHAKIS
jgi:hypothetical protein